MQGFLLRFLLPTLFEMLIEALGALAINTSTTVDDDLVATVRANKEELIKEISRLL